MKINGDILIFEHSDGSFLKKEVNGIAITSDSFTVKCAGRYTNDIAIAVGELRQ